MAGEGQNLIMLLDETGTEIRNRQDIAGSKLNDQLTMIHTYPKRE